MTIPSFKLVKAFPGKVHKNYGTPFKTCGKSLIIGSRFVCVSILLLCRGSQIKDKQCNNSRLQ